MSEEQTLLTGDFIKEHFTGIPVDERGTIALATDIYKRESQNSDNPLPLAVRYLQALADDPSTSPSDVFLLAEELQKYPHIAAPITKDIGTDRIALPINLISQAHVELVKLAKTSGQDSEAIGKTVREKAVRVLQQLNKVGKDGIEASVFNAAEKQGAQTTSTFKAGEHFWWDTVIPNVVISGSLKATALRREPTLIASSSAPRNQ